MRLLNVDSLEFREFHPNPVQKYAVASHRWFIGEEGSTEATFQDVKEKQNVAIAGYQKILDFAVYVRDHVPGVDWLWIDTCCINKQDAQEVTEAITSMFKWYRDSAVCLAYLADVRTSDDMDSFMRSSWFKRGWTLQELLAPQIVIFLSQDWQVIGHKRCDKYVESNVAFPLGRVLNASITRIASIPEAVLSDFRSSRGLSIEERLAWMTGRKTTREEDMSYSLVGLFDVSMPAIYGEGEDRARKRLLTEISKETAVLNKLPVASGAAFNDRENEHVSECLPDTRVDILRDINDWASSEDGTCMFWLSGMAGTGKSTIFKTVAQKFDNQQRLAASFVFKKGEADRGHASRLITTISTQLARRLPDVRNEIVSALEKDADIVRRSLKEQFQKLIFQPLQQFAPKPVHGPAWVIGIDALDECDDEDDIRIAIDLLARLTEIKPATFRLLVTSRPDLPVRLGFGRLSNGTHVDIRLEDIPQDVVAHDITVYFRQKLAEIRFNYASLRGIDSLGGDWPGEDAVQALVQMSQPLFIFAATACRFIGEPDEDPVESLRIILEHRLEASQLDRTYEPVLDRLLAHKTRGQQGRIVEDFHAVVGAIVVLAEPLTPAALSRVLEMSEEKLVARLQRLHSVLDVPLAGESFRHVQPLHLSFRDYLTNLETREKTPFWIDEAEQHRALAYQCLRRLVQNETLKEDLCGVEKPGIRRAEVGKWQVDDSIPSDAAYACSYWVVHLIKGREQLCDNGKVHRFLQLHFLHWLEALSWLGRVSKAITFISDLHSVVEVGKGVALTAFLEDARRFVLQNRHVFDLAPLQIYSSALIFAPAQSVVRRQFEDKIPEWLCLRPEVIQNWSADIQKLEGHGAAVCAVSFSPDGQMIASGSGDHSVRLWNAQTGEETQNLEGHDDAITVVAFAPNGQRVASGSWDKSVRLWSTRTGKALQRLEGHRALVTAIAFSPDGQTLVSGSQDGAIVHWSATRGERVRKLQEYNGFGESVMAVAFTPNQQIIVAASQAGITRLVVDSKSEQLEVCLIPCADPKLAAIAFSFDCRVVASASLDGKVRILDAATGEQLRVLQGHGRCVTAIAFSGDGQTVAFASYDRKVKLWNAQTGERTQIVPGHDLEITALSFSPDSKIVASASQDYTTRLWIPKPIGEVPKLQGHDDAVLAVAFSSDGLKVASGSMDATVRIWDAMTGAQVHKMLGHADSVTAVAFSPDTQVMASASRDCTARLWNVATGSEIHKLQGHKAIVRAVVFFPDGLTVASGSEDDTVRLWNVRTGEEVHRFQDAGYINGLAFDELGTSLISDVDIFDVGPFVQSPDVGQPFFTIPLVDVQHDWVRFQDEDVVWLPKEYRGVCSAAYGDTLVIGQNSGAMSFFRLKPRGPNTTT